MTPLRILHISDGRPGHYHLAEGVIAALAQIQKVETRTLLIKRRRMVPGRYLRMLATAEWCAPDLLLKMGYGLDADELKGADLVISSGGETLPVNLAAKRLLGAENIFIGSPRGDDAFGHYHLAEGVIAALARIQKVETRTLLIKRRRMVPRHR